MREFLLFYCCVVEHSRRHSKFAWQKITVLIFFSQNRYQDFRENLLETVLKEVKNFENFSQRREKLVEGHTV